VVNVGGEWFYDEYAPGRGVSSLGLDDNGMQVPNIGTPQPAPQPPAEDRNRILDLFKN
jgi:penicillin-binding protein 1A